MNTTKDECDGWRDPETSGYPSPCQTVIIALKNGGFSIARWNGYGWVTVANQSNVRDFVTNWRELPEPPKPKDAFEAWWTHGFKQDYKDLVIIGEGRDQSVGKEAARYIWNAAINSTKQC